MVVLELEVVVDDVGDVELPPPPPQPAICNDRTSVPNICSAFIFFMIGSSRLICTVEDCCDYGFFVSAQLWRRPILAE